MKTEKWSIERLTNGRRYNPTTRIANGKDKWLVALCFVITGICSQSFAGIQEGDNEHESFFMTSEVGALTTVPEEDTTISGKPGPKDHRFSLTLAVFGFDYLDQFSNTINTDVGFNIQLGFQKSRFAKRESPPAWLADAGYEVDLSTFLGTFYDYKPEPTSEYTMLELTKFYLGYNEYWTINLRVVDLVLEGGPFLNYNIGSASDVVVGAMTAGVHFGQHIQKGFGKAREGHSKFVIGLGFDQYIPLEGSYVGSFGITLGY